MISHDEEKICPVVVVVVVVAVVVVVVVVAVVVVVVHLCVEFFFGLTLLPTRWRRYARPLAELDLISSSWVLLSNTSDTNSEMS